MIPPCLSPSPSQRWLGLCLGLTLVIAGQLGAQETFFTVTPELMRDNPDGTRGGTVGDYNNDGWPDGFGGDWNESDVFLFTNHQGRLFTVSGDRFEFDQDIPLPTNGGRPTDGWGGGPVFGDYDNDGDLDLYLPVGKWINEGPRQNRLMRNDRGIFVDVTALAGLIHEVSSDNAIWLDYDNDGQLDLYVGHLAGEGDVDPSARNLLYGNLGDGTFADVTAAAGLDVQLSDGGGSNGGMVAADFDGDGWPDLYIGVFAASNRLFHNDGQGKFVDATTAEIGDVGEAFGIGVGDINNDGLLDIYQVAGGEIGERSLLLLNLGGGQFLDITEGAGEGLRDTGLGGSVADIDNDGDIDLMRVSGRNLFLNVGDLRFEDVTESSGLPNANETLSFFDFDNDGDLDVFRPNSKRRGQIAVNNRGQDRHWLRVELVGIQSNRSGIGGVVRAVAGDLSQVRPILGGLGYYQDELVAHFGLGGQERVDRLEIHWPSGEVDAFTDIPADQKIRVFEGREQYHVVHPSEWVSSPLVVGRRAELEATVKPALFEADAQITALTVDLSALGGSADARFVDQGDGSYALRQVIPEVKGSIRVEVIEVLIDQSTSLGPYWIRLAGTVTVLPAGDLSVFDDAINSEWELVHNSRIEVDPASTSTVHEGTTALELVGSGSGSWKVGFSRSVPVNPLGYAAVHFAFHPGESTVPDDPRFEVELIELVARVSLLDHVDFDSKTWQVVEIPLEDFDLPRPEVPLIQFLGNLEGTFYLDDIRLVAVKPSQPGTAVVESRGDVVPESFTLSQNYPNPFNPATTIRFDLPRSQEIELTLYNLAGQKVATLAQGLREAGTYTLQWDGRDDDGRDLASGIYLYRLQAGSQVETRKLLLLR